VKRAMAVCCAAWLAGALCAVAQAAPITIGLFAPSAPFPSTAARVELASRLGGELGKALSVSGSGRVYARAADFAAAVKKGEVTLALVDPAYLPAYLASTGSAPVVIAVAVSSDDKTAGPWQFVARGGAKIADLQGKHVLVPNLGGREVDFVLNALLDGGVGRDFFAKIEPAPDTASALAALALGKADAVVVPMTGALPPGTTAVPAAPALPALPNPVLVAYGTLSEQDLRAVREAAKRFQGDATIAGFRAPDGESDGDALRGVARRFTAAIKRGPFLIPAVRLVVGDLLEGRTFAIERTPAAAFAIAPTTR
jgi:ABC-type amino acid transport substrate-binding protein